MVLGRAAHKDQHGGCPVTLDRVSKHGKPRRQLAIHPQARTTLAAQKGHKLIKRERALGVFGNHGTRRHQACKRPARNMVDRHRIVFENLAYELATLAVDVTRAEHVELLRHGKDLTKAIVAPNNLALVCAFVLDGIVVELCEERIAIAHELVLVALDLNGLAVAQLHIAAHGAHHKVRDKRQPVGRLVEQALEGIAILGKVAHGQTHRCQQRRNQAKVQAIQRADEHDIEQAIIEHVELGRLGEQMLQYLEQDPGDARLQAFDKQRTHLDAIDGGAQGVDLLCAASIPASLNGREIAQQVVALKPAIAHANDVAGGQGVAGRIAIGNREFWEQRLEGLAHFTRCVMESIGNIERLKGGVPAIKDAAHQHRELLGTQQRKRRILRALQSDRSG